MSTLHLPLARAAVARLGSCSIFGLSQVSGAKKPVLTALSSFCSRQAAVAVHFSQKMINVHANYQSMGTHSNMQDSNQQTLIWKTISFALDITLLSPIILSSRHPCYLLFYLSAFLFQSIHLTDILYIFSVLVGFGTRANWGEESFSRELWRQSPASDLDGLKQWASSHLREISYLTLSRR